jgi:peptide/nickel transport system substrate-binding protein
MGKGYLARNLTGLNRGRIFTVLLISCLIASSYNISGSSSPQPPIDPTVHYVATIGQPVRIDPARAYDAVSGELLQNIYQTLIWWNDKKPVTFTPGVGYNLTIADYADLEQYSPVLCTEVPTMGNGRIVVNASGSYWRFTINTNAQFQPWVDHLGNTVPARNITAADVVYSFRRQVVYDSIYSPVWMWMTPAFGYESWRSAYRGPYETYTNYTFKNPADELACANLIQNWCYNIGDDVYFYFQQPWAEGRMKQIFAQTWGGVVNPDWVKEMGGWNGLFEIAASESDMSGGWTNNYHGKPTNTRSELDTYKDPAIFLGHGSLYASFAFGASGTGPYKFTSWDTTNKIWRIDYDLGYWQGWANAGDKTGNFFRTVIWESVSAWSTRKMLFLEGEFDVCVVPRTSIYELLAPGTNLVNNIPTLGNDMLLFCTNVTGASFYQSYVGYPIHQTAAVSEFFANEHIRRAFAWAINYTQYIQEAYLGQGLQQASWWLDGLSPQSFKNTALTLRNLDFSQMQDELNQAIVEGFNVSQAGFETTLLYNFGNDQRMIAEQLIANAFQTLNSKYKVNVIRLDWPVYSDYSFRHQMPGYCWNLLADFADLHDLAQLYMQSTGYFSILQGPPFPADQGIIDAEIIAGMVETNVTYRGELYRDLQARFYNDAMTLPLVQLVGRRWARDWVQGWYFNAMYPGLYAYDLYKSTFALEYVDIKVSVTPLTPIYNPVYIFYSQMRIGDGNSTPAKMTYAVQVTRNDNNNAVPVLYVLVGLTRTTGDQKQYVDYCFVSIAVGGSTDIQLTWWEDGFNQVIIGSRSGIPYEIMVEALPLNGIQNDTSAENSRQALGTIVAKTLVGDVNGDGIVDIFDAILLTIVFGTDPSSPKWNAYADLNGSEFIDIYDAILLANDFQNHVP